MTYQTFERDRASRPGVLSNIKFVYQILLATSLLVIVALGVFGYWGFHQESLMLHDQVSTQLRTTSEMAADNIQKWLGGRILLARNLADNLAGGKDDPADVNYLTARPTLAANFLAAYYGGADGTMTISPHEDLPPGYDPRKRGWYQAAAAAKQTVLTPPYLDAATHQLVMTVATPIFDKDTLKGVAAVDTALSAVQDILNRLDFEGQGYAFLVDADGHVLVHPDTSKVSKTLS